VTTTLPLTNLWTSNYPLKSDASIADLFLIDLPQSWAFVAYTPTVPLDGFAVVGFYFVFIYFVCEKPVNLIACYGVVKIVKAPEKVDDALWTMKTKRICFL
jgi:hypothetical protein